MCLNLTTHHHHHTKVPRTLSGTSMLCSLCHAVSRARAPWQLITRPFFFLVHNNISPQGHCGEGLWTDHHPLLQERHLCGQRYVWPCFRTGQHSCSVPDISSTPVPDIYFCEHASCSKKMPHLITGIRVRRAELAVLIAH